MSFTEIQKYDGNQAILTSERLIFNARKDNIFIAAKKDVCITVGGGVHFNIGNGSKKSDDNIFIVNSPKIQFGLGKIQPVAKADDLANTINELLDALSNLASALTSATGIGVGTVTEPSVNAAGAKLQGQIRNVQQKVDQIKSKTTFTT